MVLTDNVFKRIDWLKVAKEAGGLALTAYTGIPTREQMQAIAAGLERLATDPSAVATRENVEALVDGAKDLLKPKEANKNAPEEVAEFRKAFDELLKVARCHPACGLDRRSGPLPPRDSDSCS